MTTQARQDEQRQTKARRTGAEPKRSALRAVIVLVFVLLAASLLTAIGAGQASAQEPAETRPTVMMVVDTSGSMAGQKLIDAKEALTVSVGSLTTEQQAGLRSYGGGCGDGGDLLVAIASGNSAELNASIATLTAGGGTPTPSALRAAAGDLVGMTGPRAIVLVSDGQSTCGDPCPVAAEIAATMGIEFKVHAVGFQAPEQAAEELQCIARVTGGLYFAADDAEGLAAAIGTVVTNPDPDPAGATIGGTITSDADGSAVAGVSIDLFNADANGDRTTYISSTTTAADGTYSFSVSAGCYVVTIIAPANSTFPDGGTFRNIGICVEDGANVTDANATVTTTSPDVRSVRGIMQFSDGSPAGDVVIDLFSALDEWTRGEYLGTEVTTANGAFSFTGQPVGCYIVVHIAPKGTSFETGDERWNQKYGCIGGNNAGDFGTTLVREPSDVSSIGGTVTNSAGAGVAGVTADIFTAGGDGTRATYLESATSDAQGVYTFNDRLADCYVVVLIAPSGRTFSSSGSEWAERFACPDPGQSVGTLNAVLND